MNIIDKEAKNFMYEYLNTYAPTGFEKSGQQVWLKYLNQYTESWELDHYGTAISTINPGKEFKVVIEAHADEISWFVNYISDEGMLGVIRNGGSDHQIAPAKKVNIFTKNGIVKGVFGWPAIHLRRNKQSQHNPEVEKLFIDIGAKNKKEVLAMGVHVGCVVVFDEELMMINNKYYCGKALDNKMGGFCIAQVARMIHKNKIKLPFTLHVVNAVQEEIGLRGAQMVAHRLKPDVAIITDVTHDTTTPLIKTEAKGEIECGKGPVLSYAPAIHYVLQNIIIDSAEQEGIPFQRSASSRTTGTDTDAFAYSNKGVPSVLISLPLRYMHTTSEMAHKDDVENLIKMMYHSVLNIDPNHSFKYFDQL